MLAVVVCLQPCGFQKLRRGARGRVRGTWGGRAGRGRYRFIASCRESASLRSISAILESSKFNLKKCSAASKSLKTTVLAPANAAVFVLDSTAICVIGGR